MRSEAEIRKAVKHMEEAYLDAPSLMAEKAGEIFRWCLGEENDFSEFVAACDAIDEERDQIMKAQSN